MDHRITKQQVISDLGQVHRRWQELLAT